MPPALVTAPVYQQLNGLLRRLIRKEFRIGDRFLTERQVGERFRVSRITANKALSNLVSEGVLEFKKGVGTFVRGNVLDYDLRALVSFTDKARASGKKPSTRVLAFRRVVARELEEQVRERLRLAASEHAYYVERLRLADRKPVILERRHVVERFCPGLTKVDGAGSLYALWTGRYGLTIEGADETIRAVNLRGREARLLALKPGAAGLRVCATGFLESREPLWWEQTLYRGDAYEFRNRLGGILTARPAVGAFQGDGA